MTLYIIIFPNNKKYIGITKNFKDRKRRHLSDCFNEIGKNYHYPLYKAIRYYGIDKLKWITIELSTWEDCKEYEKLFIDFYKTFIKLPKSNGYNCTLGGDGTVGQTLSIETKQKISSTLKLKGIRPTKPYTGIPWNKGIKLSTEQKQNIKRTYIKNEIKHGTLYGYIDLKCRCELCKNCMSVYKKQRRLKLKY